MMSVRTFRKSVLTAVIQLGAETSKSTKLIHSGVRTQKTIHACHVLRSSFGDTCLHMFNTIFTVHQSPNFPLRTFYYSSLSFLLKLRLCEWFSDPHKQERSRTSTEHNLLSTEMTQRTLFSLACLLAPYLFWSWSQYRMLNRYYRFW
jgi:hypothetical protein